MNYKVNGGIEYEELGEKMDRLNQLYLTQLKIKENQEMVLSMLIKDCNLLVLKKYKSFFLKQSKQEKELNLEGYLKQLIKFKPNQITFFSNLL